MASPTHYAPVQISSLAPNIGAAIQATNPRDQSNNTVFDKTRGASPTSTIQIMRQYLARSTAAIASLFTKGTDTKDTSPPVPKRYLQKFPTEILSAIFDEVQDPYSVRSLIMTCKRMYILSLARHKTVQKLLLAHDGQGLRGCPEATIAVKMPAMSSLAVRNINNVVKLMRVVWLNGPGVSDISSPHEDIIWYLRVSQGQAPPPTVELFRDLHLLRQGARSRFLSDISVPQALNVSAAPFTAQVYNNNYNNNNNNNTTITASHIDGPWSIDLTVASLTFAQARELAELGVCAQKLTVAFFNSLGLSTIDIRNLHAFENTTSRFKNALWTTETYCRIFGGDLWWRRWQGSKYFKAIVEASEDRGPGVYSLRDIHTFLRFVVRSKWLVVTAGARGCRCPDSVLHPHTCVRCRVRGIDGALSMGLAAVCRIMETPETDLQGLRDCFVWEDDGLPREHPFFLC